MTRPHPAPRAARTTYAVWETTLRCNLNCLHCGSRAGRARPDELLTSEALDVIDQLVEVGIDEVTFAGGEPFLRPDWPILARAAADRGMIVSILTGGYAISLGDALLARDAGVRSVSVSIDGMELAHCALRGRPDAWQRALGALETFRDAGLAISCNTQLNRLSAPDLPVLLHRLHDVGVRAWQLQLTTPMGNAADHAEWILQPCEILDLYPVLAEVVRRAAREGIRAQPADCVGYFGPFDDAFQAAAGTRSTWQGCQAGLRALGIEADGAIKGCLSLPTEDTIGGNVRERPLREILETDAMKLNFGGGMPVGVAHLHGFCAECEFGLLCRGGCSNTTLVLFGERGDNPYCHHRALTLAARGRRERVVLARTAEDRPFGIGRFDLIEEPIDAPWPADDRHRFSAENVRWSENSGPPRNDGRVNVPVVVHRGGSA